MICPFLLSTTQWYESNRNKCGNDGCWMHLSSSQSTWTDISLLTGNITIWSLSLSWSTLLFCEKKQLVCQNNCWYIWLIPDFVPPLPLPPPPYPLPPFSPSLISLMVSVDIKVMGADRLVWCWCGHRGRLVWYWCCHVDVIVRILDGLTWCQCGHWSIQMAVLWKFLSFFSPFLSRTDLCWTAITVNRATLLVRNIQGLNSAVIYLPIIFTTVLMYPVCMGITAVMLSSSWTVCICICAG